MADSAELTKAIGKSILDCSGSKVDVWMTLDALLHVAASIAVTGGCTTEERRDEMAEYVRQNFLALLKFEAAQQRRT